jgi:hypothetical protein
MATAERYHDSINTMTRLLRISVKPNHVSGSLAFSDW